MSLVETWRDRGLCLRIDPREFDDGGTPIAWNACRQCPVAAECFADAKAHRAEGVYRGGFAFGATGGGWSNRYQPHKGKKESTRSQWMLWRRMRASGMSFMQIARAVNRNHSTIVLALQRLEIESPVDDGLNSHANSRENGRAAGVLQHRDGSDRPTLLSNERG